MRAQNIVPEGASPLKPINELSNNTLGSYKKKAGADAKKADSEGDFKRGDKRFGGIVKATKKEFDNDAKDVAEDGSLAMAQMANRLTDPKDGATAKMRATGDKKRHDQLNQSHGYAHPISEKTIDEELTEKDYIVIATMGGEEVPLKFKAKTKAGALMKANRWQKINNIDEVKFRVQNINVEESGYQPQFADKEAAIAAAKESVKRFRDPLDGAEIWAVGYGFDIVATMNSNGRNHTIANGGKKIGTIYKDRVVKESPVNELSDKTLQSYKQSASMAKRDVTQPINNFVKRTMGIAKASKKMTPVKEANKTTIDASKPRNFVAKNATRGGAGAHRDKKKEQKFGNAKHKKQHDLAEQFSAFMDEATKKHLR